MQVTTIRVPHLFAILALSFGPALADRLGIKEITYAEIEEFTHDVITFDDMPRGTFDEILRFPGIGFGEHFSGQLLRLKHDHLLILHEVLADETSDSPLHLVAGPVGHNLAIQVADATGTNGLLPLGPNSDYKNGTGALAIQFDEPVCFFAFRTAIDGLNKFGLSSSSILRDYPEGSMKIRFLDNSGHVLASYMRSIDPEGRIAVGFMQSGSVEPQIAGVFIQNLDLRGIGLDDVRFDTQCPLLLF